MGDETRISAPTEVLDRVTQEYYGKALIWCSYDKWTVEESANQLCGCIPDRKMFGHGERNRRLDEAVVSVENKMLADITNGKLQAVQAKRYFGKTFVQSADVIPWALAADISIPDELLQARAARDRRKDPYGRYTTPYIEALFWIIREFWQGTDVREAPPTETVIEAVRSQNVHNLLFYIVFAPLSPMTNWEHVPLFVPPESTIALVLEGSQAPSPNSKSCEKAFQLSWSLVMHRLLHMR